jgi:hypothetical protein
VLVSFLLWKYTFHECDKRLFPSTVSIKRYFCNSILTPYFCLFKNGLNPYLGSFSVVLGQLIEDNNT